MLVPFEGPSCSGKSTLVEKVKNKMEEDDELADDSVTVVIFKGPGQVNIPGESNWKNYNHHMHAVMHRLDELNKNLIILGDRVFSEAVITNDREMLRRYKCHDPFIIYIKAESAELDERGNKDTDVQELMKSYRNTVLQIFEHYKVNNTAQRNVEEVAVEIKEAIIKEFYRRKDIKNFMDDEVK